MGCWGLLTGDSETAGCLRLLTGDSKTAGHGRCALLALLWLLAGLGLLGCRFALLPLLGILLCLVNSSIFLIVMLHQVHQGHGLFIRIDGSFGLLRLLAGHGKAAGCLGRLLGLLTGNSKTAGCLRLLTGNGKTCVLRLLRLGSRRCHTALRNHRLPVLRRLLGDRLRSRLRRRLRHRLRYGLGNRLRRMLRHRLGYRLRCSGGCATLIDAVQQILEIVQGQIGGAVQIIQDLSHIAAVLGLVELGIEDDVLEELAQIQIFAAVVHDRQADQHSLAGGNIRIHIIQIQQQHIGIQHVVFSGGHSIDQAVEHTHQTALIHRAAEELCNRHLCRDVELNVLGGIDLLECHRSKTGDGVVCQHAQSHGIQLIGRLNFIDQISTGSLIFKSEIHNSLLPLC